MFHVEQSKGARLPGCAGRRAATTDRRPTLALEPELSRGAGELPRSAQRLRPRWLWGAALGARGDPRVLAARDGRGQGTETVTFRLGPRQCWAALDVGTMGRSPWRPCIAGGADHRTVETASSGRLRARGPPWPSAVVGWGRAVATKARGARRGSLQPFLLFHVERCAHGARPTLALSQEVGRGVRGTAPLRRAAESVHRSEAWPWGPGGILASSPGAIDERGRGTEGVCPRRSAPRPRPS
jgi:hypothetical protein